MLKVLRCVECYSVNDISSKPVGTIFRGQAVREEFLQKIFWVQTIQE
jgi:hypothetical protein